MEENPDVVEGFAAAMLRGTEWAVDNKEATLEHCAEINPEEGADTELTSALYDAVVPRTEPLGDTPLGAFPADGWGAWQQNLVDSGELEAPLDDLESAYTNEFVEQGS